MVMKMSGKEDIADMKGNEPDVLDRIMVMMEKEEGGEQIMAIMDKESTDGAIKFLVIISTTSNLFTFVKLVKFNG